MEVRRIEGIEETTSEFGLNSEEASDCFDKYDKGLSVLTATNEVGDIMHVTIDDLYGDEDSGFHCEYNFFEEDYSDHERIIIKYYSGINDIHLIDYLSTIPSLKALQKRFDFSKISSELFGLAIDSL